MELIEVKPQKAWNEFLSRGKHSHPFQTTEFAKVLATTGHKPRFFALEHKGERKAQILLFEEPKFGNNLLDQIFRSWLSYSPPVILCAKNEMYWVFSELIKGLKERANQEEVDRITIWGYPLWDPLDWFTKNSFDAVERDNVLLEIKATQEETLKSFRRDVRRNIKKGLTFGVKVKDAKSWKDVLAFYPIYLSAARSFGLKPKPKHFFKIVFDEVILKNRGELLLAEKDGETIAGLLVLYFGNYAISFINCIRNDAYKYFPQHVLHWHFIESMSTIGLRYFDFHFAGNVGGDAKSQNIRNFKKGWGKLVTFHEFCYAADVSKCSLSESERELVKSSLHKKTVSQISSYTGLSKEKVKAALREMWAHGLLPGEESNIVKASKLLMEKKDVWEIVRETKLQPREILRLKYYLKKDTT